MKVSTKGRYALRLMTDIAAHDGNGYVSLKDVAERQDISMKYLEQIAGLLAKAGLPAGRKFAAVSVRDWPAARQFPQQAARLCDHLRRRYGLEVLFMMMQPSRDREATERVRAAMEEVAATASAASVNNFIDFRGLIAHRVVRGADAHP